ncbi:peptidoglycan-binding protein, partial [Nocardioides guangzhouensis]
VTGTVDKATAAALQADVLASGGEVAQQELVTTAALQQTLKLAGFWDGPVDGMWTPALTSALEDLQTELGLKPTGVVDAATVAAFDEAIAETRQPNGPSASPSPTPTRASESPDATQDAS